MPPSQKWKRNERVAARMLGTERLPSNGKPQPDFVIAGFSVESKERRALPAVIGKAMEQATRNAIPGTAPLVVMQEARGPGYPVKRYAVLTLEDFAALHRRAYPDDQSDPPRNPEYSSTDPG